MFTKDLTDGGHRVDIYFDEMGTCDFESFDIYQKSHYRRYQFACTFLKPDMLVGDFACGTGYGAAMMSRIALLVYGCDISTHVIEEIRKRYRGLNNVIFRQEDILEIDDLPELDVIVSFETVEHFAQDSIEKLFIKFNQLLRTDGLLIFSTPYMQPETKASRKHHKTFQINEDRVFRWTSQAGFQIQSLRYQNYRSHDIVLGLDDRDFLICVCRKNSNTAAV